MAGNKLVSLFRRLQRKRFTYKVQQRIEAANAMGEDTFEILFPSALFAAVSSDMAREVAATFQSQGWSGYMASLEGDRFLEMTRQSVDNE